MVCMDNKHIAILGRQPFIGVAELERVFGGKNVNILCAEAAIVDCKAINIQTFGGLIKSGKVILNIPASNWRQISDKIIFECTKQWSNFGGKITLGISAYNFQITAREVQKIGITLKQRLKKSNVSMRLIPNTDVALTTATSHHNKLGLSDNKVELLIVRTNNNQTIVALSTGSQNITAYSKRDQARPMRDAFVGMLPPKLAQIMINLAVGSKADGANFQSGPLEPEFVKAPGPLTDAARRRTATESSNSSDLQRSITILDPFCGTGVILQEAALMGFSVYGTDLSEKMIRYSRDNLNWLADTHHIQFEWYLHEDDAMTAKWRQPINAVICEGYLGQPFSAPPSPAKLAEVVKNCDHIITEFLKNLRSQIEPGTPVCVAVPAWRDKDGHFTHLPITNNVGRFGYKPYEFMNVSQNDMIYYRTDQVVARELLVMTKI